MPKPDQGEDDMQSGPPIYRAWRTSRLPPLVNAGGAAEILGIHVKTLYKWMRPGSGDFGPDMTHMIPPARLDGDGPAVWVREDVERHAAQIGRPQRGPRVRKSDP
jgi:hypothetical protein